MVHAFDLLNAHVRALVSPLYPPHIPLLRSPTLLSVGGSGLRVAGIPKNESAPGILSLVCGGHPRSLPFPQRFTTEIRAGLTTWVSAIRALSMAPHL
jgi:hypothetical protein